MSQFVYSCEDEDVETVEEVLQVPDMTADVTDENGRSPLHVTAINGNVEIVEMLLKHGARVHCVDGQGWTPLMNAARCGHTDVIDLLLQHEAKVAYTDEESISALYLAAQEGYYRIVQSLMANHAPIDVPNVDGWLPIHIAVQNGHLEVVKVLLTHNNKEVLEAKLSNGATPFYLAVQEGYEDITKYLMDKGADINIMTSDLNIPFHVAVQNGYTDIVNLLIMHGVPVLRELVDGATSVYIAAQFGHNDILKALLKTLARGQINNGRVSNGFGPIHVAAQNGHLQVVKTLMASNADITKTVSDGASALFIAAQEGHDDIVRFLIEAKCDVNAIRKDNFSPLHAAAQNGHLKVVKTLRNHGALFHAVNNENKTPFELALENDHEEIAELLRVKIGSPEPAMSVTSGYLSRNSSIDIPSENENKLANDSRKNSFEKPSFELKSDINKSDKHLNCDRNNSAEDTKETERSVAKHPEADEMVSKNKTIGTEIGREEDNCQSNRAQRSNSSTSDCQQLKSEESTRDVINDTITDTPQSTCSDNYCRNSSLTSEDSITESTTGTDTESTTSEDTTTSKSNKKPMSLNKAITAIRVTESFCEPRYFKLRSNSKTDLYQEAEQKSSSLNILGNPKDEDLPKESITPRHPSKASKKSCSTSQNTSHLVGTELEKDNKGLKTNENIELPTPNPNKMPDNVSTINDVDKTDLDIKLAKYATASDEDTQSKATDVPDSSQIISKISASPTKNINKHFEICNDNPSTVDGANASLANNQEHVSSPALQDSEMPTTEGRAQEKEARGHENSTEEEVRTLVQSSPKIDGKQLQQTKSSPVQTLRDPSTEEELNAHPKGETSFNTVPAKEKQNKTTVSNNPTLNENMLDNILMQNGKSVSNLGHNTVKSLLKQNDLIPRCEKDKTPIDNQKSTHMQRKYNFTTFSKPVPPPKDMRKSPTPIHSEKSSLNLTQPVDISTHSVIIENTVKCTSQKKELFSEPNKSDKTLQKLLQRQDSITMSEHDESVSFYDKENKDISSSGDSPTQKYMQTNCYAITPSNLADKPLSTTRNEDNSPKTTNLASYLQNSSENVKAAAELPNNEEFTPKSIQNSKGREESLQNCKAPQEYEVFKSTKIPQHEKSTKPASDSNHACKTLSDTKETSLPGRDSQNPALETSTKQNAHSQEASVIENASKHPTNTLDDSIASSCDNLSSDQPGNTELPPDRTSNTHNITNSKPPIPNPAKQNGSNQSASKIESTLKQSRKTPSLPSGRPSSCSMKRRRTLQTSASSVQSDESSRPGSSSSYYRPTSRQSQDSTSSDDKPVFTRRKPAIPPNAPILGRRHTASATSMPKFSASEQSSETTIVDLRNISKSAKERRPRSVSTIGLKENPANLSIDSLPDLTSSKRNTTVRPDPSKVGSKEFQVALARLEAKLKRRPHTASHLRSANTTQSTETLSTATTIKISNLSSNPLSSDGTPRPHSASCSDISIVPHPPTHPKPPENTLNTETSLCLPNSHEETSEDNVSSELCIASSTKPKHEEEITKGSSLVLRQNDPPLSHQPTAEDSLLQECKDESIDINSILKQVIKPTLYQAADEANNDAEIANTLVKENSTLEHNFPTSSKSKESENAASTQYNPAQAIHIPSESSPALQIKQHIMTSSQKQTKPRGVQIRPKSSHAELQSNVTSPLFKRRVTIMSATETEPMHLRKVVKRSNTAFQASMFNIDDRMDIANQIEAFLHNVENFKSTLKSRDTAF